MSDLYNLDVIRPDWDVPENVIALTTTRPGGFSQGCWRGMNLASHVGDDDQHVEQNRSLLEKVLLVPSAPVWLDQIHGCDVAQADKLEVLATCDATTTVKQNVVCAVLTADCLPLLISDTQGSQVAAVHAGWRGLAAGIIEQTIKKVRGPRGEIRVWLGPAIGSNAFEVGAEVRQTFVVQNAQAAEAFKEIKSGKWLCDLYLLAKQRLSMMGVNHVTGAEHCTYQEAERFYSYRRDGVTGRMASLIWMT